MRISPSMAVSLLGLFISLGTAGYAANGGALLMGLVNSATARTYLGANYNGTAMQIANTSTGAAATALSLSVAATRPPMMVNSTVRVTNLNADYVDGLDATLIARSRHISFNLNAGATSAPIVVPANVPVELLAVINGPSGIGRVSLFRNGGGLAFSTSNGSQTSTAAKGTKIDTLDPTSTVLLEVAGGDAVQVHNLSDNQTVGTVTLFW